MTTSEFIHQFASADVCQLALCGAKYPGVDLPFALQQIAGRQRARVKLPKWAQTEGLLYPPPLSLEQCSSESTAQYKASVVGRLCSERAIMVDLTGGFGVDFSFLAPLFSRAIYVEQQSHLCDVAQHNFELLGLSHVRVVQGQAEDVLATMPAVSLAYLDPARRDSRGGKVFGVADCSPNLLQLHESLLHKASVVMVKLSPMLDWHQAVRQLPGVSEVHIVSVGGECRELLLILRHEHTALPQVWCVNDGQKFTFQAGSTESQTPLQVASPEDCSRWHYLYEPHASVMKAGCFNLLTSRYAVKALSANSHLMVSEALEATFPGRIFTLQAVSSLGKKHLRTFLDGLKQANVAVRNFPLKAEELRRQLHLRDGGDTYIFGTTLNNGKHVVLSARKLHSGKVLP